MGHRLHLAVIQEKCRFHQCLTVAGRAGANNMYIVGKQFVDLLQRTDGGLQRTAVVAGIEGIQQGTVLAHQCDLCGGGAGVNAQISVAVVGA